MPIIMYAYLGSEATSQASCSGRRWYAPGQSEKDKNLKPIFCFVRKLVYLYHKPGCGVNKSVFLLRNVQEKVQTLLKVKEYSSDYRVHES